MILETKNYANADINPLFTFDREFADIFSTNITGYSLPVGDGKRWMATDI